MRPQRLARRSLVSGSAIPTRRVSGRIAAGLALAGACGLAALSACDDTNHTSYICPQVSNECPAVMPSYVNDIAPIIATHCGQCHRSEDPNGPWPFEAPSNLLDWSLEIQIDLSECLMPPAEADRPLSDADRDTLYVWLSCGAPLDAVE